MLGLIYSLLKHLSPSCRYLLVKSLVPWVLAPSFGASKDLFPACVKCPGRVRGAGQAQNLTIKKQERRPNNGLSGAAGSLSLNDLESSRPLPQASTLQTLLAPFISLLHHSIWMIQWPLVPLLSYSLFSAAQSVTPPPAPPPPELATGRDQFPHSFNRSANVV